MSSSPRKGQLSVSQVAEIIGVTPNCVRMNAKKAIIFTTCDDNGRLWFNKRDTAKLKKTT